MASMFAHFLAISLLMSLTTANSPLISSLQSAMERAVLAHQASSSMDLSTSDVRVKAAWADCLLLCEDTINQLNRSMTSASSNEDTQTWLSAAMANQQTCHNGFVDLNSPLPLPSSSFVSSNLSQSISNSLAICKGENSGGNRRLLSKGFPRRKGENSGGNRRLLSDGFPSWVSAADRKLLQSSTLNANLVVAQDGSGNYKTISEAVTASIKLRSGTSRFVIHVKAGVYNENVQVTKSMKNLMIIVKSGI